MYAIASIDRIFELKQEIAALVRLNALYKANSGDFTFRTHQCRCLRLVEIREELGVMKQQSADNQ
jgi:hypothetical protein